MKFIDAGLHCFESQAIMDQHFGLNDTALNARQAKEQLKKFKEIIQETDEFIFFRTGSNVEGTYVLISKVSNLIDYFIKFETNNSIILLTTVTQVALWKRLGGTYIRNITSKVFYDILLKKWKTIVSDSQQTKDGYKFWVQRLRESYEDGYIIGIVDTRDIENTIQIYDGNKEYIPNWLDEKDVYGNDEKYKYIRYFISTDKALLDHNKDTK